jgi:hypothetical protein
LLDREPLLQRVAKAFLDPQLDAGLREWQPISHPEMLPCLALTCEAVAHSARADHEGHAAELQHEGSWHQQHKSMLPPRFQV